MRNDSGVTMVEIAIVLVIIIMIAAFAVMSGRTTLEEADASEVYIEMNSMKEAINSIIMKGNMDESFMIEKGKQYDLPFVPVPGVFYGENVTDYSSDWYIIFGKDNEEAYKESKVKKELGFDAINHTYIVNFNTDSVELYKPITILNTQVRTYDEVRALVSNS